MKRECSRKMKLVSIMLAVALVMSVFTPAATVKAAGTPSVESKYTAIIEPKVKEDYLWIDEFPAGAQVMNVKSSNTKVLTASWRAAEEAYIVLKLRKAGKSVVSFDVVYNGQTIPLKSTVTVRKYQRPCATFKVGNKNYASRFKKNSIYQTSHKGTPKNKVTVKAAKGWKLVAMYYGNADGSNFKMIRNKKSVRFSVKKKDSACIYAVFKNKKTKHYETVVLMSKRKK